MNRVELKMASLQRLFSGKWRYRFILAISVFLSVISIPFAVFFTHDPADGQRGGAFATAITFFALFVSRDAGSRTFDALITSVHDAREIIARLRNATPPVENESEVFKREIAAVVAQLKSVSTAQKSQNRCIAWSAGIATLFWGFGDILTKELLFLLHRN